jgi:RND family efflux transporter MFP subunit
MKINKTAGISIAIFVVVGVIVGLVADRNRQSAQSENSIHESQSAPVAVHLMTVENMRIPQWLDITGSVKMEFEAPVSSRVMGRVLQVRVHEGDYVRRGEQLVVLDARDLTAGVQQASANLNAADVGYQNAREAATMEASMSKASIAEAQAGVSQSESALKAAIARQQLVDKGPRQQERQQADLAVVQAKSMLVLADKNLHRMENLFNEGAISRQQLDTMQSQYAVAKAQYDSAVQAQSMTQEGSRQEDIKAAQEQVQQAQGAVVQARAALRKAQAAALQVKVRLGDVRAAAAQIGQMRATLQIARVSKDYATVRAPFDGIISKRLTDPGAFANPGAPLLIVQGGATRMEAVAPEDALRLVHRGGRIPVRLDAIPNRDIWGVVTEISPQGDPASHTFVVKIDLPKDPAIRSGMYGRARLNAGISSELLIPTSAIIAREGLHYVFTADTENTARIRLLTVGQPVGDRTPVLSGLNPGDRIILTPLEEVKDGHPVVEASASSAGTNMEVNR